MTVIGITGPTGAGKTTALRTLEQLGVRVLDCDRVYHELLDTCQPLRQELTDRFGDVFDERGLDRRRLGALVWGDKAALADLNAITHKYIMAELVRQIEDARAKGLTGVAIDAIALVESGAGALCDTTVAVVASEETRISRIMAREGIDRSYAEARIRAQKDGAWYWDNCDHTLTNDGTEAAFQAACLNLFQTLLTLNERNPKQEEEQNV